MLDFDSRLSSQNLAPVCVSLTNFAQVFFAEKKLDLSIFEMLYPGDAPTLRPNLGMKDVPLNDSKELLSTENKAKYDRYYSEVEAMIDQRKKDCNAKHVLLLDVNILPDNNNSLLVLDGEKTCHPLVLGQIIFQYQITKVLAVCRETGLKKNLTSSFADPVNGRHVIQLGICPGAFEPQVFKRPFNGIFFEALSMAKISLDMLNKFNV